MTTLADDLRSRIDPERVLDDAVSITKFAADASAYLLRPQVVVIAATVADVQAVLTVARRRRTPVTFRAAGTSLSGQAQSDGILCEVQRFWRGLTVEDDGARIKARPGTIGAVANAALARHGTEIGPDPASLAACTIGGIVANNSSGMCCGVERNAYHTLDSLKFVLPSGAVIDTADEEAEAAFARAAPDLAAGLLDLRRDLLDDAHLVETITRKYALKNTTGYGLNALVDYDTPLRIFEHLLVGSEGTLAFLAEITLRTIRVEPHARTALLVFPTLEAACRAVPALQESGARAIELMDGPALLSAGDALARFVDPSLVIADTHGLLVEWRAETDEQLLGLLLQAVRVLTDVELVTPPLLYQDPEVVAALWAIRKGMLATIGGRRPAGSSIILEDVVFPPEHLAAGMAQLRQLLDAHGYAAVIFGHAKDGNLHFLISENFGNPGAPQRYAAFLADLVALVVRHDGALKGEHGTGRNMAPFVAAEWGQVAAHLMHRLKTLADPLGILNPGTIVPATPISHVENLKATPVIDAETDRCVECGFCERGCPSSDLTTTPRQRIVLRRRIATLEAVDPTSPELAELHAAMNHQVLDTCATDGMCQLACPVGINTGDLVKRLRAARHSRAAHRAALEAVKRFTEVERLARASLGASDQLGRLLGPTRRSRLTQAVATRLARFDIMPVATQHMPRSADGMLPATRRQGAHAVYFPACVNRIFASPGEVSVPTALVRVAARAGSPVWIPDNVTGVCCATPWVSKGFPEAAVAMATEFVDRAWSWTDGGELPVVTDASSCAHGLSALAELLPGSHRETYDALRFLDSTVFVGRLVKKLAIEKVPSLVVHPTCANHRDGTTKTLVGIARRLAESVLVPNPAVCCGFGGDRGFLQPELTASATAGMAAQIAEGHDGYLSANRPCEIGMSQATGQTYESFLLALERQTR
ncbi:MAG: FAD-binding and (Fe-S)-binding domain-containing protein [Nocardioides sp.]